MRALVAGVLGVLLTGAAQAGSYDDFLRAQQAYRTDHPDEAIAAYTAALSASDFAAGYRPTANLERGLVYLSKGQCTEALNDFNTALKARPDNFEITSSRMRAHICLKENQAAIADANALIGLLPTSPVGYAVRGDYYWNDGHFAEAAEDFKKAASLKRSSPYNLIWYAISAARAGSYDTSWFEKTAKDAHLRDWQETLVDFLQGKITNEKVYRAAERGEGEVPSQQKCEADFYIGEWRLISKQDGAKALIEAAAKECPENFKERDTAKTELGRLP